MLKMDLKTLRKELRTLSEKYPISDLWTSIFFLLDEHEAELRQRLIEYRTAKIRAENSFELIAVLHKINLLEEILGYEKEVLKHRSNLNGGF